MVTYYRNIWQTEWETSERGRDFFGIQSQISKGIQLQGMSRKEEVLVHQIRLGKCRLNYYLHDINCHENGLCDSCQVSETIEHYLLECKRYKNERKLMQKMLKINVLNIRNIMKVSIEDNFRALCVYLNNTKRL